MPTAGAGPVGERPAAERDGATLAAHPARAMTSDKTAKFRRVSIGTGYARDCCGTDAEAIVQSNFCVQRA
jgi:hypothetical protein